uniref:Uncharacterized protein n=1 Tax=Fagus sylvatica TaxID=28930 RepID=A0A2N9G545_FAGSY
MKGNRGGEGIPHELLNLNLSLSLAPLQPLFKWVSADCVEVMAEWIELWL